MKKIMHLIIIATLTFLLSIGFVCAVENTTTNIQDNNTYQEKLAISHDNEELSISNNQNESYLKESFYYDVKNDKAYPDDTIRTKDIVKYYGSEVKFEVKVLDDDNKPANKVLVIFGKDKNHLKDKITNNNGVVYFNINYNVGKHEVLTWVPSDDKNFMYVAYNIVTIKSTIPTKLLSKSIKQKNKKFSIKFLNKNGKALAKKKIKIKVQSKYYTIKTNNKGIAKIKINSFKVGKHKILAINPATKEMRKITVKIRR